ncbi:MAG: hypothetical protein DWQ18_03820 [Crenarchaeota archaeon]|nr:MAG: hypothetical protein DWQ17_09310 [Thermoproteota archaeon]RDJ34040.1 MAG: hypothetical protein DWQ18_03820 [Thermoproteota archaeon]RDJ36846.1 MAG: hypothetical protein DWQ13_06795 [Thermoproteota archaeon]RDJ37620.1 MAG: hypothetical protein DWQ19_04040 [Thermoproteota archaeon]
MANWILKNFQKKHFFMLFWTFLGINRKLGLKNKVGSRSNFQNDSNVLEIVNLEWIKSILQVYWEF